MHVQYVALCDQIIVAQDGKPSLIGIFSDVLTPGLPITIPRMSFAARILFTMDELGSTHRVEVGITDPEGVELGRPGGHITLPSAPPETDSVAFDLPMHLDMFQVQHFGRYTFMLQVDGDNKAAVQLNVRHAPPPPDE